MRLATAASMERLVTRSYGIPHLPAGLDWTADPDVERRLTSALVRDGNEAFCRMLYGEVLAGRCVLPMFEDLLEHAMHWAPDVVINDCAEWAGPLLALALGIRNLAADNGLLRNVWDHHADHIRPRLTEHRSALGLGPEPRTPSSLDHGVLTPAPRELLLADLPIPAVRSYRHENPRQAREELPRWVRELPRDTPLVYVMLGSSGNCAPGMAAGFRRANQSVLEALADFDGAVVVAVGRGNVSQYLPQPRHVRVVEYAPQTLVLRRADVFVTHCGFGGSREAIEAETPMVMLPWFADQSLNGREMAARGMGLLLDRFAATPSQVRDAVFEVLTETRYRAAVSAVRRQMMALPDLAEIVDDVIESCAEPVPA
ncbi:N-glycosyltransferase [Saccharopolyspora shandongensis]|uniref:N-glycosyltransferase n=1 Tax=Saccharopolyspora shandongensis TaxID=418495 RepID=A0A1H3S535_9PSEU|nr:N-glycosyltransferase [Saccharopolyspora shandongensis]